jgi:HAE1 family hydrophobic/amphiphilic exporter-1
MIRQSIRRPVAVAMAYASVAALGAFAWRNIPIELYPDTQLPRLSVNARWSGASPETVEAFLTSPLESAIQQVRGVEKIISDSEEGEAQIQVEFDRDTDMDFARLELSERIAGVEEDLPPTVDDVVVEQYVPREFEGQNQALLRYEFTGPYTMEALYQHLEEVVVPELGQVPGVAQAVAYGGRKRLLEIRVDEVKATALGLSPWQIGNAVRNLDLVREAGAVREGEQQWTITIVNRPEDLEDVRNAIVAHRNGDPVRLSDVATVHDAYEEARLYSRINGSPSLNFVVLKETGANAVQVADAVKARVERLQRLSPFGSRFILNEQSDQSREIRAQLSDLRVRAIVAAVVIFVVLLLFLRSFRSAGMIFATIAFSVLIALNLIYFGGLSLNLLTLMGLAMGFGLIVDNSIVVLENVFRRWQGGQPAREAAEEGAREVVLPILASTATTLIVFVPFVYLQGELRLYYVPLAIVVVLTLLASLFVAFTFIPALSSRILSVAGRARGAFVMPAGSTVAAAGGAGDAGAGSASGRRPTEDAVRPPLYVRFYEALVAFTLRHPWFTVTVTAACLGGSYYLFDEYVSKGVVWGGWGGREDTRITITTRLPRGSNLDRSDQLARFFEEKLAALPEVEQYTTQVRETSSFIEVTFPDSLELTPVPVAIKELMFSYSLTFTGADVYVRGFGPSFYGGGGSPPMYHIQVMGYNYGKVREIAEDLGRRLERQSRIHEVDTNSSSQWYNRDRAIEYTIRVDRTALARHDLSVQDLTQRIQAFVASSTGRTPVKLAEDEVLLEVKVRDAEDLDVLALREAILPGPLGRGGIRLGDVVSIEPREVLSSIHREDQQYHRTVAYEFRGPRKLGDVFRDAVIESTQLPPGYTIETEDRWRWSTEEQAQMWMVLLVSIVLVYMVTAALFESVLQPLCVLLTVPMALVGVFMMFFFTEASFTREAWIGVIMMGGIVVNGAILLVDHVNRVRSTRPGLSFEDAILRGTLERVRPILMTAATTVLGLLPLVLFSESANANIWNALGFALIGGLIASTLFTLTTTPALYAIFVGPKARREAWEAEVMSGRSTAAAVDGRDATGDSRGGSGPLGPGPEPHPA